MTPSDPAPATPPRRVRVPASTSNLGPGFDQLGLALELWLEVDLVGPIDVDAHRFAALEGTATEWPREANRVLSAFDAGAAHYGLPRRAYEFSARSEIPLQRGLGSSGAAVAAGLHLAAQVAGVGEPELVTLTGLGARIEGHPDNVAASLFGGCTLGIPLEADRLRVVQQALDARLRFAVCWPSSPLATEEARAVLPRTLPLEDVIWTTRRLTLLLEGLRTGGAGLLRDAGDDRLHTPYRLPLIEGAAEAIAAAYEAGAWLAAISGSGSALIALHEDQATCERIANAMCTELRARHADASARVLRAALRGAHAPD